MYRLCGCIPFPSEDECFGGLQWRRDVLLFENTICSFSMPFNVGHICDTTDGIMIIHPVSSICLLVTPKTGTKASSSFSHLVKQLFPLHCLWFYLHTIMNDILSCQWWHCPNKCNIKILDARTSRLVFLLLIMSRKLEKGLCSFDILPNFL